MSQLVSELLARQLDDAESWPTLPGVLADVAGGAKEVLLGLRADLASTSGQDFAALAAGSAETSTHFAWRLFDDPTLPFSVWLNEYKPQSDWLPGYANVVHNHRYDFCTFIVAGSYLHQRYDVLPAADDDGAFAVVPQGEERLDRGASRFVPADAFHCIPHAAAPTVTLLVKSRPRRGWSMSVQPSSGTVRRHVPVEGRQALLVETLERAT